MKLILTINGGSSSIKFAAYEPGDPQPQPILKGQIERIGAVDASISISFANGGSPEEHPIAVSDHNQAAGTLIESIEARLGRESIAAIGHRIVHGGVHLLDHQLVTPEVMTELRRTQPLDLAHLPREIALIEAMGKAFPGVPQVACFDTAFHRDMPRVARLLPIPRKYDADGLRRFGFHGISYSYLMEELRRIAGDEAANGRIILAHLGSASMVAVKNGKPIETTMAFTPLAGLVMGTRPGDLDPGLLVYLLRSENWTPEQLDDFLNRECGLKGVSETGSDMRDLAARRANDIRAAEAVDLFYRARQWIGALAASMGGLDTLVFSGGIGEHAADVRAEVCQGLEFLEISIEPARNQANAAVISPNQSRVVTGVIPTDEEVMIAMVTVKLVG